MRQRHHLRAWLFKILTNVARNHFRRHHSWEEPEPGEEDVTIALDLSALSESTALDVREALRQLRPFHQTIVLLVDVEDFTLAEAADMLHIPLGTAASRLARARQELQKLLQAYRPERSRSRGTP